MAIFNYQQLIYGGMVAIAAVDENVSKFEKKYMNDVFDRYIKLSNKEKNEVLKIWEQDKDKFTDILIEEMRAFSKRDQIEAYSYIMKFISWSKTKYNQTTKSIPKGVDPVRAEINLYYDKANEIRNKLDFTDLEYANATRTRRK
jgi:hypothetical protein